MTVNNKLLFTLSLLFCFAVTTTSAVSADEVATDQQESADSDEHGDHDHKKDENKSKDKKKPKTKLKIGKDDTVITVGDMHCKHCAKKIASKLYTVKGVVKVRTDVKADVAIVTPEKKKQLSTKSLWSASQKAGFQPVLLEGPAGKFEPDEKTKEPKPVPKKDDEKSGDESTEKEASTPASS